MLIEKLQDFFTDSLQTIIGCDSLFTTILVVTPLPIVSIAKFTPDTLCITNSAVTLPTGTPILGTYSGNGVTGGDFDPDISGIGSHFITYSFTDGNGCSNSDSTRIVIETCVGINETNNLSNIDIFPNPTKEVLTIHVKDQSHKNLSMRLVDVSGKTIKNITILENSQDITLDIANLNKGIYFLILPATYNNSVYKVTKL